MSVIQSFPARVQGDGSAAGPEDLAQLPHPFHRHDSAADGGSLRQGVQAVVPAFLIAQGLAACLLLVVTMRMSKVFSLELRNWIDHLPFASGKSSPRG